MKPSRRVSCLCDGWEPLWSSSLACCCSIQGRTDQWFDLLPTKSGLSDLGRKNRWFGFWIRCFSRIQWSSTNAAFLQAQAFGGGAQIWESNGLHHGLAVWLVTTISEIAFCLGDGWNHAEPISILCELHMSYLVCTVNVESWATALSGVKDRYGTQRLRLLCALCGIIPMVIYITAQMISFAAMVEGMTLQLIPKYACMHLESTLSIHNDNFGNWWRTGDFLSPSAAFVIWHESWGWSSACWF